MRLRHRFIWGYFFIFILFLNIECTAERELQQRGQELEPLNKARAKARKEIDVAFARREEVNKEVASIGRDVRLLAQKDNKVRSNLEIKLRRREEMEAEFENRQTKIAKLERELEALHQDAEQLPDAKDAEVKCGHQIIF